VRQRTQAYWSDENNACLLELDMVQRREGTYTGAEITSEGYRAVIEGLKEKRGLVHDRDQVRNQLRILKKVEELGSNYGDPVRQRTRAYWSDENNACLLELAKVQRRAGTYTGAEMTGEGYRAVIEGLKEKRGLVHDRDQVRNQLRILKKVYSF
jgi:RIO-like serine/threonine protein kinase